MLTEHDPECTRCARHAGPHVSVSHRYPHAVPKYDGHPCTSEPTLDLPRFSHKGDHPGLRQFRCAVSEPTVNARKAAIGQCGPPAHKKSRDACVAVPCCRTATRSFQVCDTPPVPTRLRWFARALKQTRPVWHPLSTSRGQVQAFSATFVRQRTDVEAPSAWASASPGEWPGRGPDPPVW